MSKKKKNKSKSKKSRGGRSMDIRGMMLQMQKIKEWTADSEVIQDLIVDDKLDPYKAEDYKHLKPIAQELGWGMTRLKRAIQVAGVHRVVKDEIESKSETKEP